MPAQLKENQETFDWGQLIRPEHVHGSLYTHPAIFEAELGKIWYRTWVYVGHASEVPEPNDYIMKSIGPEPVIMARDQDGNINLLLNRCAHRGNQVCLTEKGNAGMFVCPYHGWGYRNTGELRGFSVSRRHAGYRDQR
jgi:fatty-acyl-CoA synthase